MITKSIMVMSVAFASSGSSGMLPGLDIAWKCRLIWYSVNCLLFPDFDIERHLKLNTFQEAVKCDPEKMFL